MKKSIVIVLLTISFLLVTSCAPQAEESKTIRAAVSDRTFTYEKGGFGGEFFIMISSDGTFQYYEGGLSSYIGIGSWALEDDILILSDDNEVGYPCVNRFKVDGDNLIFLAEDSDNFIYIKVADGERFMGVSGEAPL
ncbi:MAG: hypothetical protein NC420_12210 [Eubacterium sp.]|nr:hypothetical protein [Eubacterium sp.]